MRPDYLNRDRQTGGYARENQSKMKSRDIRDNRDNRDHQRDARADTRNKSATKNNNNNTNLNI